MVGDHCSDKWRNRLQCPWEHIEPAPTQDLPEVSREEFDKLKAEVAEMVALLKRAKKYDEDHSEPACETDDKMRVLREIASMVGVDLDEALGK